MSVYPVSMPWFTLRIINYVLSVLYLLQITDCSSQASVKYIIDFGLFHTFRMKDAISNPIMYTKEVRNMSHYH